MLMPSVGTTRCASTQHRNEGQANKFEPFVAQGCHCKKSSCLKKYCECFAAGRGCSDLCSCRGCQNPYMPLGQGSTSEADTGRASLSSCKIPCQSNSRRQRKARNTLQTVDSSSHTALHQSTRARNFVPPVSQSVSKRDIDNRRTKKRKLEVV